LHVRGHDADKGRGQDKEGDGRREALSRGEEEKLGA
jgi:hypothetical protein